jgi:hypothetical protein
MLVYLDESGELGWNFSKPFSKGGSSRYLSIAFLLIPSQKRDITKRLLKKIYKFEKRNPKIELKGKDLTKKGREYFSQKVKNVINSHKDIKIIVITVKKENVQLHIRQDSNKLYNYMINLALIDEIQKEPVVTLVPDPRSIKVESKNSMIDYLQTKLWFDRWSSTVIKHSIQESHRNLNLQFVDFVAHIFWSKYELNNLNGFNILKSCVNFKELFF